MSGLFSRALGLADTEQFLRSGWKKGNSPGREPRALKKTLFRKKRAQSRKCVKGELLQRRAYEKRRRTLISGRLLLTARGNSSKEEEK